MLNGLLAFSPILNHSKILLALVNVRAIFSSRWLRQVGRALAYSILALLGTSILLILVLRWVDPPSTSFVIRDAGTETKIIVWVSLDQIAAALQLTAIAAEDQKFPHHFGFDLEAISKAIDERSKRRRGASTISQQVAKNLFLWPGRSWVRKGIEAYFTLLLELLWNKQRILEAYLNIAEFAPGVFGIEAASRRLYGKLAAELTWQEAALLAAVLPNPKRFSAANPTPYVQKRAADILRSVQQLGGTSYLRLL